MIVTLNKNITDNAFRSLLKWMESRNVKVKTVESDFNTVMILTGDTAMLDPDVITSFEGVLKAEHINEPFTASSRNYRKENTVITVSFSDCTASIGAGETVFIAGPCTIESEEQIVSAAKAVKKAGASILRGGAFKPRTSPYTFRGLREKGLDYLLTAKKEAGIPTVSEIMDINHLPLFEDVDILQVGARNMQNYELLSELGHTDKPILLKRAPGATLRDLLMSAEYIMSGGNEKVILCERGIRTFENATRNTLDISAIPMLKELSHLPVIADPSHATGISSLVCPMTLAAVAAGADGVMTEVHENPADALCDGKQAITPDVFADTVKKAKAVFSALKNN